MPFRGGKSWENGPKTINFVRVISLKIVDTMDKLVTMNAQTELQTSSRLEKILAERRASLAQKDSKRA